MCYPGDKDDITRYAERILARAMTVEVAVRTDRDPQQEEALHQVKYVNLFIWHGCFLHSFLFVYFVPLLNKGFPHSFTSIDDLLFSPIRGSPARHPVFFIGRNAGIRSYYMTHYLLHFAIFMV